MNNLYRLLRYDWPLHFTLLFLNWLPDNVFFLRFRGWLASFFFAQCGSDLRLGRNVTFYNSSKVFIGSSVYIAFGNWFGAADEIRIENEVLVGPNCIFASSNHTRYEDSYRYGKPVSAPIFVGKGSWIGGNCAILAGSSVGEGTVVGANSVVRGKVPPNVLYAGNPGRVVKKV